MPVPADEIARLKAAVDLPALIRTRGIDLKPKGRDLAGLCPFHPDQSPSMIVTPGKNLFHCFSCGAGGDAIAFVMKLDSVDFPEAVRRLKEFTGMREAGTNGALSDSPARPSLSAADAALLDQVVDHYHRALMNDAGALRYLESRGLVNEEAFKKFRIGHSDGGLSRILPSARRKEGEAVRGILKSFGIFRKDSGRDHFEGCVTFPIFDENGILAGMYGRRTSHKHRTRHLYLPGPHRGIWNREAYSQPDVILCESIIDALTFYVHGIRNVTCAYGVEGFTDEMMTALKESGVRRLFIAYDSDAAGDRAALKLAERTAAEKGNIECLRVRFPMGMDANDYARRASDPAVSLRELVLAAGPVRETKTTPAVRIAEVPVKSYPAPASLSAAEFELAGEEVRFQYSERRYRVRGLFKNSTDHILKINLRVSRGDVYHLDTFDLLSAKARQHFIEQAAKELAVSEDIVKYDLGRILDKLEELQEKKIKDALKTQTREVEIPEERKERALAYGRDPELVLNILRDVEKCGLVGERTNALIGYLGTVSRKTDNPLAIIIQSSSAAGKSTLMEALLAFVPEEDRIKFSMMTGQSLYYMSRDLRHRILAISEEEGVERAKYAIKLLQSEGKITIATTIKDPDTGLPDTREFSVEGPVMILLTTTNVEIDEELQNRCLLLTINEDREQTNRIQKMQRGSETLEGILRKKEGSLLTELHMDFQRMLRPLVVVNPFAEEIEFPDTHLRMRRDHRKFLTLIRTIALLHQHQRQVKTARDAAGVEFEYIEAAEGDVALAIHLSAGVFGHSIDELAPQTRSLLNLTDDYVTRETERLGIDRRQFRFTRRSLREYIRVSDRRLRAHLDRLVELEYVVAYGGGQGKLVEYELLYSGEGKDGGPFLPGLSGGKYEISPALREFLANFGHLEAHFGGENQDFGPTSAALRPAFAPASARETNAVSGRGPANGAKVHAVNPHPLKNTYIKRVRR